MPQRPLLVLLWSALAVVLLVALIVTLNISMAELVETLKRTPFWLVVAVTALTLSNQIVGAMKWRVSARWLAPDAPNLPLFWMIESTSYGSFFGQIVPPQISTAIARWLVADSEQRQSGAVLRSTLFEQLFDLVILLSAAIAGLLVWVFQMNIIAATTALFAVAAISLFGTKAGLFLVWRLVREAQRLKFGQRLFAKLEDGFLRAKEAPVRVTAALSVWSFVRLLIVGARAVLVTSVFAPAASIVFVSAGYPLIGLLTAIPTTPGGLGVLEWSWSGLLIAAGATASVAAVAAIALRFVNMIALSVIILGFLLLRMLRWRG